MGKKCIRCGEFKELSEFPRKSDMTDGRNSWCRVCKNAYMREQRSAGKWRHDSSEYRMIRVGKRTVREHRLVLEKILGRPPSRSEYGHHIDDSKQNNSPKNLFPASPVEHYRLHKLRIKHIYAEDCES